MSADKPGWKGKSRPVDLVNDEHTFDTSRLEEMLRSILTFAERGTHPERQEFVRPDRVKLITFPSGKVQAATTWLKPVHLIGLNRGLILFVYRVARVLAAYIIVRNPSDGSPPAVELSGRRVAVLMSWLASPLAAPWIIEDEDWAVDQREARTAGNIAAHGEHFVIAHEVAHIQMGHRIQDGPATGTFAAGEADDLDDRGSRQEVEADTVAMAVHIESTAAAGFEPRAAVVGLIFFLMCLGLAETVGAIPSGRSHAPAGERALLLRLLIAQRYGDSAPYLLSWADDILVKSEPILHSAMEQYEVFAGAVQDLLEEEFRTRSAVGADVSPVDDQEFVDRVMAMVRRAPDVALRGLASNLMSADELASAGTRSDRYRRHALAVHAIRQLPPELVAAVGLDTR